MSMKPISTAGERPIGFDLQFATSRASNLSFAAVPIEQLSNDGTDAVVGHGSGFIKQRDGRYFLVTARHVFDGRNPFTAELLSEHGYIPRLFAYYPMVEHPSGSNMWVRARMVIEVADPDHLPWFGDPAFDDLRTDIAAWPLFVPPGLAMRYLSEPTAKEASMMMHPGLECMVIGFPSGPSKGMQFPVWRRGVMASEPLIPWDDKPMFLLDCTTSPGFSGSPVFRHHVGPVPLRNADGGLTTDLDAVVTTALIGVYAGRLTHPHFGGEVPYVFYENRIAPILSAALAHSSPS